MILHCDGCGECVANCAKIPCGFLLEADNRSTRLIMPTDKSKFRNFCIKCLFEQSEELKE